MEVEFECLCLSKLNWSWALIGRGYVLKSTFLKALKKSCVEAKAMCIVSLSEVVVDNSEEAC